MKTKLKFMTCFANPRMPISHGYNPVTGKTLCGKKIKNRKNWVDEGDVEKDDNFSCHICQNKWVKMDYEFD